jgi:hypothetical protein
MILNSITSWRSIIHILLSFFSDHLRAQRPHEEWKSSTAQNGERSLRASAHFSLTRKRSVHQRMHELSPDASPIVDQHVFHEAESQERSWPRWDIQIVVSGRCVTHEWDIVRDTSTFVLYDQFQ